MSRKASALIALCCAVAGAALSGCDEATEPESGSPASGSPAAERAAFTGTRKIKVGERSVNVSCTGNPVGGRPVVVLLHGGGSSDQPDGPQSFETTGKILTGVLDRIAGGKPVVLAGHWLGGLIAAGYSPSACRRRHAGHRDRFRRRHDRREPGGRFRHLWRIGVLGARFTAARRQRHDQEEPGRENPGPVRARHVISLGRRW
ncbi:hypothetical protein AB0N89_28865 [Amycolatopsis sp. NPDC089917]|uniref:alpha/beta fold hydrolase n=1 Tax=Amycolatopsis sp. NPDC089917 TaxID=3155187 RepID=UPI0034478A8E